MPPKPPLSATALRRRAEAILNKQRSKKGRAMTVADSQRQLHELQVHQIELEMQNTELQESRDAIEAQVEKYSDLYDFAPVSYFSLDEQGVILEANLTGAALIGVDRSRLLKQRLSRFVALPSRPDFLTFLQQVFAGTTKQACELALSKDSALVWTRFRGIAAITASGSPPWCRVSVADITSFRVAEEAQRRVELLAASNKKLENEITRREAVQKALKKSEQHQIRLLEQSYHMQTQLRHLSHQLLEAQEEERRRISRELHDVIAQTLVGINVHLVTLSKEAMVSANQELMEKIALTRELVEKSVDIVHRFASDLRPAVLDDLGLIPALRAYLQGFMEQTGIRVSFTAFAGVEKLNNAERMVLYRIVQEALNNVSRHAKASLAIVRIHQHQGTVRMEIHDNGQGFQVEGATWAKGRKHLGLLGMRERVEMIGGTFVVESATGRETTLRVEIPQRSTRKRATK